MALSGHVLKELALLAVQLDQTQHGSKEPLKAAFCERFSLSKATLGRELQKLLNSNRKQRSDAGKTGVSLEELQIISAYWMEHFRKNSKKDISLKDVLDDLRANHKITAALIDNETGEIISYYSVTTIATALRNAVLHPDQLRQLSPSVNLKSKYPNWSWQIDSTTSAQFYMSEGGFNEIEDGVHYKNKPENLKKIEKFRVICYSITDHRSGHVFWWYCKEAESGENTVRCLAHAMEKKTWTPFHGKPEILQCDKGIGNSSLVQRFCNTMKIRLIPHATGNSRAVGSVENSHRLIQESFEKSLKILPKEHKDPFHRQPRTIDELNAMAQRYQAWWNFTKVHTRTKKTRIAAWMTISAEQLITVPCFDVLLSLATEKPIERGVKPDLTIEFKSRYWDVKHVPGVYVTSKILVHWHPFKEDTAMAVITDETGHEVHIALPEKQRDDFGQFIDAQVIGESSKSQSDTIADTNRKLVAQISAGTDSLEATEKKRKSKSYIPFNGEIDSQIQSRVELPSFIPKRGTALDLDIPSVELVKLNPVEMAEFMLDRLGDDWNAKEFQLLQRRFPQGATEPELMQYLSELENQDQETKPFLRRVI